MSKDVIPRVEVAVVLIAIRDTDQILSVHNPCWGAFTLPMTKRRTWEDPAVRVGRKAEDWLAAATREAAEKLGRTFAPNELPVSLLQETEYKQSDVDGIWKMYCFHIFRLPVPSGTICARNVNGEWLTPGDFRKRVPISGTAKYLLDCLRREGLLPPW